MAQKRFDVKKSLSVFKLPTAGQMVLMLVGLAIAVAVFLFLRSFVSCWSLTKLPGAQPASCPNRSSAPPQTTDNGQGTPQATPLPGTQDVGVPEAQLPPPWDGASRINILLMGYDYGQWSTDRSCPCRSDSMIVLTLDPISKTAGMLSVQRDLWVNIPGFGYNRINAALYFGDQYKLPGGGPELARKTVESFLGIPIQYYVLLDFNAFTTIIDDIGGIDVNVPQEIIVDPLGKHNTTTLQPGMVHMDGAIALAYARQRHTANDDIDRSGRQQQVILAVREKMTDKNNLLKLIANSPSIYNSVSSGVKTNFPTDFKQMGELAVLAMQVPLDNIQKGVINYTMVAPVTLTDEQGNKMDVLKPFPEKIRALVEQIFGNGSTKPMASSDPTQLTLEQAQPLMQQEKASVIVVNAAGVDGLGQRTADYLKSQGMNVINFGNTSDFPDSYAYPPLPGQTQIIVHSGKIYAMQYLKVLMNTDNVTIKFDPNAPADVIVAVGSDWAAAIPAQ